MTLSATDEKPGMAPAPLVRKQRGRPRSVDAHFRIIHSTLANCARDGFADLTIEAIARDASVGKSTIYRHWRNKKDLVAEAINSQIAILHLDAISGDLEKDVRQLVYNFAEFFSGTGGKTFARIVGESQGDPALAEMILTLWVGQRHGPIVEILETYRERGQTRAGVDPERVSELVLGRILLQLLVLRREFDDHTVDELADLIINGISPKGRLAGR